MKLTLFDNHEEFADQYLCSACDRLSSAQTIEEDEALQYTDAMVLNILHYLGYYKHHAAYLKILTTSAYRDLGLKADREQLAPASYWVPNALDALREGSDVALLTHYFPEIILESWHVSPDEVSIPLSCRELLDNFIAEDENAMWHDYAETLLGCVEEKAPFRNQ